MVKSLVAKREITSALVLAGVVSLAGCSSLGIVSDNKIDYKSASKAKTTSLEVPPDLTQIRRDNRFAVPDSEQGMATASSYNQKKLGTVAVASGEVAITTLQDMRIERNGNQRYLVVKRKPETLWPVLKDFWQENGFVLSVESESAGILETDWAENRAKIPDGLIRNTIGKVFDSLYSTGERDRFRTRVDRNAAGETEVYIVHRGAQEVVTGAQKDGTTWVPRANDATLEAEMISRLMMRLGANEERVKAVVAQSSTAESRSKIYTTEGITYLTTDEGFERSWRRVGLALDRIGFVVEDRDRTQGLFYVRYIDEAIEAKEKGEKGFLSKLFSWGSAEDDKKGKKFRILVKEQGAISHVSVYDESGKIVMEPIGAKIIQLLNDQLK
jgi:outer membrane protein assembly factor BamC